MEEYRLQTEQPLDLDEVVYVDSTKGKRFGGFLIDWVVQYGLGILLGLFLGLIEFEGANRPIYDTLFAYLFSVIYYWIMESTFQRTVGKMILGMQIIKDDGSRPNPMNVLGRSFCRLIPFDALSLLLSDRAWHDTIPQIRVVDKK